MFSIERTRYIVLISIGLTAAAEAFYLIVWGVLLFPNGSILGKIVWTTTCGLAMGAVIASITLLLVENRLRGKLVITAAASIMIAVGIICAVICSNIDAKFEYFGGSEHQTLFIWSGVGPALIGGPLYGWLIYRQR